MKTKIVAFFAALMMLFGAGALPASAAPQPEGYIDWTTKAYNQKDSLHRVLVAQHRSGQGSQWYVNPGYYAPGDTDSVYVYYTRATTGNLCTSINGTTYTSRGWVNTGWWRQINVRVFRC